MNGTAQKLRDGVASLRAQQKVSHQGPLREDVFFTVNTRLDYETRFSWAWTGGPSPGLEIRVWHRDQSDGQWKPIAKAGLRLNLRDVTSFAEGVAAAIERIVVTPDGLRVRPPETDTGAPAPEVR
jgi:hypothetical protein